MSLGNTTENDLLALMLNNTALPAAWTTGAGSLRVHLHTADPGDAGSGSTNEISYTGYPSGGLQLNRSGTGDFSAPSGGVSSNVNQLQFGLCTAGSGTATHMSLTLAAGQIIASGPITPNIVVSNGVNPTFAAGAVTVPLD